MGIKENIKMKRTDLGLTLEELAGKINTSKQTIQRYESGIISNIPTDKIEKLAIALHTTPAALMDWDGISNSDTTYFLDQKLAQIGYKINGIEADGSLWIEYPDGDLEISANDLKELDQSSISFLKFKLNELKEKHIKDFKKK